LERAGAAFGRPGGGPQCKGNVEVRREDRPAHCLKLPLLSSLSFTDDERLSERSIQSLHGFSAGLHH
jgi:hypothetical protein